MLFLLLAFWILGFEGSIGLNGRSHTLLASVFHRQPVVSLALAMELPGTGSAARSVIGTEMSGANLPDSATPGGVVSVPGSSGAMRPELPGPYLPGSSDSTSLPINFRRVQSKVELACSQVATVELLLHQTLASIHNHILHLVQVNLGKKKEKILLVSSTASSMLTCFFHVWLL
jgi:hypothetical protein